MPMEKQGVLPDRHERKYYRHIRLRYEHKRKKYLPEKYGKRIGQASVTGYCIKFRALKNIDVDILADAIWYGVEQTRAR